MAEHKYLKMQQRLKKLKDDVAKEARTFIEQEAKTLFEKHPEMLSFSWQQYTPYFNDGDECVFSAHTDCPRINDVEEYDDPLCSQLQEKPLGPLALAFKDVVAFLHALTNDDLRELFGDHVKVTVTRKDVKVEEYNHD